MNGRKVIGIIKGLVNKRGLSIVCKRVTLNFLDVWKRTYGMREKKKVKNKSGTGGWITLEQ